MSDTPDIIGSVKELLANYERDQFRGDGKAFVPIVETFPAIAQALLIAVEALEKIDALEGYEDERVYKTGEIVTDALSRIRSLPAS